MSADAIAPALTGSIPAPPRPREVTGLTAHGDLAPMPCPRLAWDSANAEESLATVFARVSETAHSLPRRHWRYEDADDGGGRSGS
jgi:hypothetical protein